MTYTLNTSQAYQYHANREAITLNNQLGVALQTVVDAKRLQQDVHEREVSLGDYTQTDIDWRLPSGNVNVAEILPGMSIIDSQSIAYAVIEVDSPSTYMNVWRLVCRQVRVGGLYNAVDYRPVVNSTDSYGDRLADWTTFPTYGHYAARIQPQTAETVDILGKRGFMNHFSIFLLPDLNLNFGDIFVDTANNNTAYKTISWKSKKDLACALEVIAEIQP